jgi:hypothetical protein
MPTADWTVLPERFSKEPYGAYVRRGDDNWYDIVRWYTTAIIEAEEQGVTAANAEEQRRTAVNPNTRRLLGVTPELGQSLKLDPAWAYNAIRAIGICIYDPWAEHAGRAAAPAEPTPGGVGHALPCAEPGAGVSPPPRTGRRSGSAVPPRSRRRATVQPIGSASHTACHHPWAPSRTGAGAARGRGPDAPPAHHAHPPTSTAPAARRHASASPRPHPRGASG